MADTTFTGPVVTLRPAAATDAHVIADLWHRGWRDGHLGHVPPALLPHRHLRHFSERVPARLPTTTVGTIGTRVVGFVTTSADEIEQLYVDGPARGTGVAGALLAHGEAVIATHFDLAWLAVVAGNARARRFYERNGWRDAGPVEYAAEGNGGATIHVPAQRYEKRLTRITDAERRDAASRAHRGSLRTGA